MYRSNQRNRIIIFSLIGILLLMAAGYAAFKTNLEIKGNTGITSNWDVEIINISEGEKTGKAKSAKTPSWTKTEANMEANLYGKEDSISYIVTIENKGTLDAKLDNINIGEGTNEDAINVSFSGYIKGQTLKKQSRMDVKVTISYNPNYEGGETSSEINTSFDFIQNEGGNIKPTNDYLVTYNYITNGGTSSNAENEYLPEGSNINLSYTASKEGYEFVGWNTSALAKEGLTELTLTENTTLFAIFKRDIKVTYEKGSNVKSIGKESENCTIYNNDSCTITLPSIEVNDGFGVDGWYDGESNIGTPNESYQVKDNKTLTAKDIQTDYEGPAITFDPSIQSEYTNGTEVSVKLDDIAGIKAGQAISYAWSASNNVSPFTEESQAQTVELQNKEGDKSTTVTIPKSTSNTFTGTYYLWIKGGVKDILENTTIDTVSKAFNFDNTPPTVSVSTSSTAKSITVTASASALSGISKYEYSLDGEKWYPSNSNVYVFSGLNSDTEYNIEVRATSGIGKTNISSATESTETILLPTFAETVQSDKTTVTIAYPEGCGSTYTCSYIKDDGEPVTVNDKTVNIDFTSDGNLIGIVSDGQSEVSNVYEVEMFGTMKSWEQNSTSDFHNDKYRNYITSVEILDNKNIPKDAAESWDVSAKGDRSVMAWVIEDLEAEKDSQENAQTDNSEEEPEIHKYYKLYIGADGGVKASNDSSYTFYNFTSLKKIDLTKLDTSQVTNMEGMFQECSSIIKLDLSNFDTSQVTNMEGMFWNCSSLTNLYISNFDTSRVTYMHNMFNGCSSLTNLYITNFNTSQVTRMDYMFYKCNNLTSLDVSNFDTSKVNDMSYMFYECSGLTSLDLSNFNTSKVANMSNIFRSCSSLTSLDLSSFDTSHVLDMKNMFWGTSKLKEIIFGEKWTTKNVTNMSNMFANCSSLTSLDLSGFDTSNVTSTYWMFYNCSSLTSIDLSNFDTSNVNNMSGMFWGTSKLKEIIFGEKWATKNVANMGHMFDNCNSLISLNLSNFDTSLVIDMNYMFANCNGLTNLDLSNFDTSNVTSMAGMFGSMSNLIKIIYGTGWTTENVQNMSNMFANCSDLTNLDLSNFDTSNVTNMSGMFQRMSNLTEITYGEKWTTENVTNMSYMFTGIPFNSLDLSNFNTNKVTNMQGMFSNMSNLTKIIYGLNWTTENVTDISYIFSNSDSFISLDLSNFDTSNVTNMRSMFYNCSGLTNLDLSNFDTSKVTNMSYMFQGASNITDINFGEKWTTKNVTNMAGMFYNCSVITSLDLSNFDTSKVTDMSWMFSGCGSLTSLDLSSFDTNQVTDMNYMFNSCGSLTSLDLSSFDTNQVTDMHNMFSNTSNLKTIYVGPNWTTENADITDMFTGCGVSSVTLKP